MVSQQPSARGVVVVVGDEHAAFTGGHRLDGMEAESGDVGPRVSAYLPNSTVMDKAATDGVTGIFDHHGPVGSGDLGDRGHVARLAGVVDGDHGAYVVLPGLFERHGAEVIGDRIDVAEIGRGPDVSGTVGAGQKRVGGRDHSVAWPDAGGEHGQVQSGRAIAYCHGVLGAHVSGKALFEFGDFGTGREEVGAEDFDDGGDVGFGDGLFSVRKQGRRCEVLGARC